MSNYTFVESVRASCARVVHARPVMSCAWPVRVPACQRPRYRNEDHAAFATGRRRAEVAEEAPAPSIDHPLGVARGQWLVNEGLQTFYLAATAAGAKNRSPSRHSPSWLSPLPSSSC